MQADLEGVDSALTRQMLWPLHIVQRYRYFQSGNEHYDHNTANAHDMVASNAITTEDFSSWQFFDWIHASCIAETLISLHN